MKGDMAMSCDLVFAKFLSGRLLATKNAISEIPPKEMATALYRHLNCDWGDICDSDKKRNDHALDKGERLLSAYHTFSSKEPKREVKFWIITEADRSATTVLLPSDY